jgi:hypothetical protein
MLNCHFPLFRLYLLEQHLQFRVIDHGLQTSGLRKRYELHLNLLCQLRTRQLQ